MAAAGVVEARWNPRKMGYIKATALGREVLVHIYREELEDKADVVGFG